MLCIFDKLLKKYRKNTNQGSDNLSLFKDNFEPLTYIGSILNQNDLSQHALFPFQINDDTNNNVVLEMYSIRMFKSRRKFSF